jgi:hypothetical protein
MDLYCDVSPPAWIISARALSVCSDLYLFFIHQRCNPHWTWGLFRRDRIGYVVFPDKTRFFMFSVVLFVCTVLSVVPFLLIDSLASERFGSVTVELETFSCFL